MKALTLAAVAALATAFAVPAAAETERYSVIFGGKVVGHLTADMQGDRTAIDFDYKNDGRGPTMKETLRTDANGLPVAWDVTGTTTFGSKVEEHFARTGRTATWTDSTGKGSAPAARGIYVSQSASPWATGLYARAILKRATWDMARYLGRDQSSGSVEKGKLADFFLVPGDPTKDLKAIKSIAMVVKDGTVYFPAEVYSEFGIEPFARAPKMTPTG